MPAPSFSCLVALLLACSRPAPVPLDGTWTLEGPGVQGQVEASSGAGCDEAGVMVTLHGPSYTTGGPVPAQAVEEQPGLVWVYFPLQTGLGAAEAAMRLQGEQAMVPLGAREGELEVVMARRPGPAEAVALAQAGTRAAAAVAQAREDWAGGAFRLLDEQDRLVGEVLLRPDQAPLVGLYDLTWWTGGLVWADRLDDGPDIVLSFPVEPALQGEEGQMRLNGPTSRAVVPADRVPTDLDRHLRLQAGVVGAAEREAAMAAAREQADSAEREAMIGLGRLLAQRARTEDGRCLPWQQVQPGLADVLVGYDLVVVAEGDSCVVEVDPTVTQHRRRLRARIGPEGLLGEPTP